MFALLKTNRREDLLVLAGCVLFIACLPLSAFHTANSNEPWKSWLALLIGWLGFADGKVAWFANPSLITAVIMHFRRKPEVAAPAALIAMILALSFLFSTEIITDEGGGHQGPIILDIGYWLWLGSTVLIVAATIPKVLFDRDES